MKIDINKQYQTRDGRAVTLYCTDAPGLLPVHGRIEGKKAAVSWDAQGRHSFDDLLHLKPAPDWRDEIPWEALKPEVRWVARDDDGEWWGFESKPEALPGYWSCGLCAILEIVAMPTGPTDWREAIAERPADK